MMRHAFTLIELMVVITTIALLAAMTASGALAILNASKKNRTELVLTKVDAACRLFYIDVRAYPRGASAAAPIRYAANGDPVVDPTTGLPIPENDGDWLGGSTTWNVGNGLFARLGSSMTTDEKNQAITNAETLRHVEFERFYHIGSFGNLAGTGLDIPLEKPAGWLLTPSVRVGNDNWTTQEWSYADPIGPSTPGEWELKAIFDRFRFAPIHWRAVGEGSGGQGYYRKWSYFARFTVENFQRFITYARPRDATDAYTRALRNGVEAQTITFSSAFNDTGEATVDGKPVTRNISITTPSQPWFDNYLADLEARHRADVDSDGFIDILDAYERPLIYINEGIPARQRIIPLQTSLMSDSFQSASVNGVFSYQNMLRYHPDPDAEIDPNYFTGSTTTWDATVPLRYYWVTDKPNSRNVPVRADAAEIAIVLPLETGSYKSGSAWIYAKYGFDPNSFGDLRSLAGTLVPSRVGVIDQTANARDGDLYYLLTEDREGLREPFNDLNVNGQYDVGEPYVDRNRSGTYDDDIARNDIRLVAAKGAEREIELWSAGRYGLFHAHRFHPANADNIGVKFRK